VPGLFGSSGTLSQKNFKNLAKDNYAGLNTKLDEYCEPVSSAIVDLAKIQVLYILTPQFLAVSIIFSETSLNKLINNTGNAVMPQEEELTFQLSPMSGFTEMQPNGRTLVEVKQEFVERLDEGPEVRSDNERHKRRRTDITPSSPSHSVQPQLQGQLEPRPSPFNGQDQISDSPIPTAPSEHRLLADIPAGVKEGTSKLYSRLPTDIKEMMRLLSAGMSREQIGYLVEVHCGVVTKERREEGIAAYMANLG